MVPLDPSKATSDTDRENAGYNQEMDCFVQSYENNTMLDSSILIAPLVFFIAPNDPRFIKTVERILLSPDKGGLTSAGLVYRYDTTISDDGEFRRFRFSRSRYVIMHAVTMCVHC